MGLHMGHVSVLCRLCGVSTDWVETYTLEHGAWALDLELVRFRG